MEAVLEAFAGRRGRPADLLHRLHHQGLRPALRRPQGQPCRPDDPRADGRLQSGMGIAEGEEWDTFAGLDMPAGGAAATSCRRCPFNAAGRRRTEAPVVPIPAALPRPDDRSSHPGGFGQILRDIAARGQRARRAHRHHLARRHRLDQSRRLGQPARPLRPHTEAKDVFRERRSPRRSCWRMSRTASTSSSASPRTTCS